MLPRYIGRLVLLPALLFGVGGCLRGGFGAPLAGDRDASAMLDGPLGDLIADSLSLPDARRPCTYGTGGWRFGEPMPLTTVNLPVGEFDFALLSDSRTAIFGAFTGDGTGPKRLFRTQRATVDAPFAPAEPLPGFDGPGDRVSLSVSHDLRAAVLVSNHVERAERRIFYAWRASPAVPWRLDQFVVSTTLNAPGVDSWDAELSPDGLTVYFAPSPSHNTIVVATRSAIDSDFSPLVELAELTSPGLNSDPTLTTDARVMVFVSNRPGGLGQEDLWFATRQASGRFSAPRVLPQINTPFRDREPSLSPDGCELFFSSDRPDGEGDLDIYRVPVLEGP